MKVAICCLLRGYNQFSLFEDFLRRCRAIKRNLSQYSGKDLHEYDHLIFHEGNISQEYMTILLLKSGLNLQFVDVSNEFIWNISSSSSFCKETPLSNSFSDGYKSMCRFWFDGFLRYTERYDYIVRIDEDCVLLNCDIESIIQGLAENSLLYATPRVFGKDDINVTQGLSNFVKNYSKLHELNRQYNDSWNPYTNLFFLDRNQIVSNLEFMNFCQAVHDTRCIYINRWGDLPLWGCALQLFFDRSKIIVIDSLKYEHSSFGELVNKSGFFDELVNFKMKISAKLRRFIRNLKRLSNVY